MPFSPIPIPSSIPIPAIGIVGRIEIVMIPSAPNKPWTAFTGHNLFTNVGRSALATVLVGVPNSITYPDWIAIGTGTASATANAATGLQFEINRSQVTTRELRTQVTARFVASYGTTEGNGTIAELGLFSQSGVGTGVMFAIASASVVKNSSNQMQVTWMIGILTGSGV